MAIDWTDIRYRGDANDVEELLTTYRVADYLATYEENRRQLDHGVRERLLKEGIRLSERLTKSLMRPPNRTSILCQQPPVSPIREAPRPHP